VRNPVVREALTPHYGFGCKRPSFSNSYLRSFNLPHVSLETAGITRATGDGLISSDGRSLPFDMLVCATGFQTYEKGNLPTYAVHGRAGLELASFWEAERYQAYQGATVPNFPNFFMMVGPYAATGSSWFSMIENQSAHIARCLRQARALQAQAIEVTPHAHQRFFTSVQRRQRNTVFYNNQCAGSNSFYFDKRGDALFYRPASGLETYLHSRLFRLSNYRFTPDATAKLVGSASANTAGASASPRPLPGKDLYDGT
jgi:cation diffusion facilitator CzcD-associated flavoprotein CzcO